MSTTARAGARPAARITSWGGLQYFLRGLFSTFRNWGHKWVYTMVDGSNPEFGQDWRRPNMAVGNLAWKASTFWLQYHLVERFGGTFAFAERQRRSQLPVGGRPEQQLRRSPGSKRVSAGWTSCFVRARTMTWMSTTMASPIRQSNLWTERAAQPAGLGLLRQALPHWFALRDLRIRRQDPQCAQVRRYLRHLLDHSGLQRCKS